MSDSIVALVNALPETLPPDPAREWKINHAGRIDKTTSKVLIGLFTAFAIIAVAVRVFIHIRKRGKLFIDDYLVLVATASLAVETGMLYHMLNLTYVETAISKDISNVVLFTRGDVVALMNDYLMLDNIYMSFAWTTNYVIKLSFLALFRQLVRDVSRRLNWYWWFVLCFTVASWIFNFSENMIICGASRSTKCFPYPKYNIEMGAASTAADVITDFMIISIPILLLRKTQLRLGQKLRILTFLCLSITMAVFALGRLIGGLYHDYAGVLVYSIVWTHLWLHLESSVAVIMGGVTAFRTVFAAQSRDDDKSRSGKSASTLYEYVLRLFGKTRQSNSSVASSGIEEKKRGFLSGPRTGASLKGMRTFIRRNGRDPGHTTVNETLADSTYDPLESYHNFVRHGEESTKLPSTRTHSSGSADDFRLPERPMPVLQTHNMV